MSVPERIATLSAKGEVRQALRDNIATQLAAAADAAGATELGIEPPTEWYDSQNRRTMFQYMQQRNHPCCQTVYQSRPSTVIERYSGSGNESTMLRGLELTVQTVHIVGSWEPITYHGKELVDVEDVMALRSDIYNGAVMRCLRENITFGTSITRVDMLSDYAEVDPSADIEGLVALATVRVLVTQEVVIQNC